MRGAGRISNDDGSGLENWNPEGVLSRLSQDDARLSRGFLPCDPSIWFSSVSEHWLPLFHTLSLEVEVVSVKACLDFPDEVARRTLFLIDGESALLGVGQSTIEAFVDSVSLQKSSNSTTTIGSASAEAVMEYLERRLLTSLGNSWSGPEPLNFNYLEEGADASQASVLGSFRIDLQINGKNCPIWVGLGQGAVDRIDSIWRASHIERRKRDGVVLSSDQIHTASIELAELAVPPALLIDYIRGGTLIDLEVPVSNNVRVRIGDDVWVEGELQNFDGRFAVSLQNFSPVQEELSDATTRVRIELASVDLDAEGVAEHAQVGAVLVSDVAISSNASIVISEEHVANGVVGLLDGNFALTVLSR